jgi:hypothetical protein
LKQAAGTNKFDFTTNQKSHHVASDVTTLVQQELNTFDQDLPSLEQNMVKITTSDEQCFTVEKAVAEKCGVLKNMMEDVGEDNENGLFLC